MSHTPGPWLISDFDEQVVYVKLDEGEPAICATGTTEFSPTRPIGERLANARLIAAAPDLLSNARRLLFFIEEMIPEESQRPAICAIARVSISKAEGR
jgi:hypothetical protein